MADNFYSQDILAFQQIIKDSTYKLKLEKIRGHFKDEFGGSFPDFYIRVPGRVNLIGEHIDYCGYSVCPMAIRPEIIVAVKVANNSKICVINVEKQYADLRCDIIDLKITNDGCHAPFWANYFLCGIKGVLEYNAGSNKQLNGLNVMVAGSIPPSAGLSSSSALVCAGALAFTYAFDLKLSKNELANITAHAEHFIGTEGGGMDQAIIFCADKGCASHIRFNPLHISSVQLPENGTFVIAQSLVTKNKAASSDFNTRVVECRIASLVLSKNNNNKDWKNMMLLSAVQQHLNKSLEHMINIVKEQLHEKPYTKTEICEILNLQQNELEQQFLTHNTKNVDAFKLHQRALHVYQEALRVEKFCKTCSQKSYSLRELGEIMNESHTSLKKLYECSHPQVNKLVSLCLQEGAFGARLTGAGWGGCVVALVEFSFADNFVNAVKSKFYTELSKSDMNLSTLVFATEPFPGANVFDGNIL